MSIWDNVKTPAAKGAPAKGGSIWDSVPTPAAPAPKPTNIPALTAFKSPAEDAPFAGSVVAPDSKVPLPSVFTGKTSSTTPQISEGFGNGPNVVDIAKGVVQSLPRATAALALTGGKALQDATGVRNLKGETIPETVDPSKFGPVATAIFGNEPVKNLQTQGADLQKKYPNIPAPAIALGVAASTYLDLTPFGGTKKGAVDALTAVKDVATATKVLRSLNVAEDLIPDYAKLFAKTSDKAEVTKHLDNLVNLQKTTKPVANATDQAIDKSLSFFKNAPEPVKSKVFALADSGVFKGVAPTVIEKLHPEDIHALKTYSDLEFAAKETKAKFKDNPAQLEQLVNDGETVAQKLGINLDQSTRKVATQVQKILSGEIKITPTMLQSNFVKDEVTGQFKGSVATAGKIAAKRPQLALGGVAGLEPQKDKDGNIVGVKFNPATAALGVGAVALTGKSRAEILQEIDNVKTTITAYTDALGMNGAKDLLKYYGRHDPRAENLDNIFGRNVDRGTGAKSLDSIVTEKGFTDVQDAHKGVLDYLGMKDHITALKTDLKTLQEHVKTLPEDAKAATKKAVPEIKASTEDARASARERLGPGIDATEQALKDKQAKEIDFGRRVRAAHTENPPPRGFKDMFQEAFSPLKRVDPETQTIYKKFKQAQLMGKQRADEVAASIKIPESEGLQTIYDFQAGKHTPYTEQLTKTFEGLYKEAQDRGIDLGHLEHYLPQVYQESSSEIKNKLVDYMLNNGVDRTAIEDYIAGRKDLPLEVSNRLKLNPNFSKERVFPDYRTAIAHGLTPKFTNPAQLAGHYVDSLEKAIANRDFLNDLKSKAKILSQQNAPSGWKAIDRNFAPEGFYAPPPLANLLNGLYRDENNLSVAQYLTKGAAETSKKAQEIALSAGLPYSSANFFTIGQTIKEITAGNFKAVVPFVRSNFTSASIKYFEDNAPALRALAKNGVDLSGRIGNYKTLYDNSLAKPSIWKKVGIQFDKAFNDKTFQSFMPQLMVSTFKDAEKKFLAAGKSAEEAETLAAEAVKKFHGITDDLGRSKGAEEFLSAAFFAPKFREGLINVLGNNFKAFTTEFKNPAFYKNRRLMAGMIATYGLYNYANKQLTGGYMWQNEPNRQFALKIPLANGEVTYFEFMPSQLAFARNLAAGGIAAATGDVSTAEQKFGSLFSMPLSITANVLANKDYFGTAIYKDTDSGPIKALKIAKYVGLQVNHPYITELMNQLGPEEKQKPLYQSIVTALEIPLKFSSQSAISKNAFYNAMDAKQKEQSQINAAFKPKFDSIQALIKDGNTEEAHAQVDALSDDDYKLYQNMRASAKSKTTQQGEAGMYDTVKQVRQLQFEGKTDQAQAIVDGLSDDDYKLYKLAKNKI